MQYNSFVFRNYSFDTDTKTLSLQYGYDDSLQFTETYEFDFPFVAYDSEQLDRAFYNLFMMAGVSYYKMYLAPTIVIDDNRLDAPTAAFFGKTYQRGLGELFYVNKLDPRTPVEFPFEDDTLGTTLNQPVQSGMLVGLGGGKDSLVTVEALRAHGRVATWSLNHADQLKPLADRVGLPHFTVNRIWDASIAEHNKRGGLNGHIPISAIFACVGTVVGILSGYSTSVVSNENSANEPTLTYDGVDINHQYSKSLEFEQGYQALLTAHFGDQLQYFSFLRPLSELAVAEQFAKHCFETYKDVFSSCNRAFVHTSHSMSWCGECSKCAFVFLMLTPFVPRAELEAIWHGKNLLLDPSLALTYRNLLGIEGEKPLECIGEIRESRAAMRLAQQQYPELQDISFELPDSYDFRKLAPHSMPPAIYEALLAFIAS